MITEEIKNAANEGNVLDFVKCIKGYYESIVTWVEEFEDENTHEIVSVDRFESQVLIPTSKEIDHINELENIFLKNYKKYIINDLYLIVDNLEGYINILPFVQELVKRGEAKAMCMLAECFLYGDEMNGIYKDSARAIELYNEAAAKGFDIAKRAINQMKEAEEEDDSDVNLVEYHITGPKSSLDSIKKLIENCHEEFGEKNAAFGELYIPYSALMNILVGSFEYHGNVLYFESADGEVVINAECDTHSIEALMCALYDCFTEIEINFEIK